MYRYRDNSGATRLGLQRMEKHLAKIGQVVEIQGKRWSGKYLHQEGVFVKGMTGTARFNSVLWGYGGEGPRGLVQLLVRLGVDKQVAETVAFRTPRHDQDGLDWTIKFPGGEIASVFTVYNERPVKEWKAVA